MLLCLIPPHIEPGLQEAMWDVLESHRLDPLPLRDCTCVQLTEEQVEMLCSLMLTAPLPAFGFNTNKPYLVTVMLLESNHPGAREFLKDALAARIARTADVPVWAGGHRQYRAIKSHDHPNAYLREMLVVVPEERLLTVQTILTQASIVEKAT